MGFTGSPDIDIVFIHGIRGGPFASWRTGDCPEGTAQESCVKKYCWPTEWLSPDIPSARLLSLEYAAPASGWEVGNSERLQHALYMTRMPPHLL